jgi:hypothetical protein
MSICRSQRHSVGRLGLGLNRYTRTGLWLSAGWVLVLAMRRTGTALGLLSMSPARRGFDRAARELFLFLGLSTSHNLGPK